METNGVPDRFGRSGFGFIKNKEDKDSNTAPLKSRPNSGDMVVLKVITKGGSRDLPGLLIRLAKFPKLGKSRFI
jgi:hypothetical protein